MQLFVGISSKNSSVSQ